jgi:oxygen-dependent protoporphyrinogen oxidase
MDVPNDKPTGHFAVVGGGVAGIGAAHYLRNAGHRVDVIERDDTLGGRVGVDRLGDRPIMMGGKNIGRSYTELRAFLAAMQADTFEYFGVNTSRIINGELITFDSMNSRLDLIRNLAKMGSPVDLSKLLWLMLKVRRHEANRFLGSKAFTKIGTDRDHEPLTAYFGPELVNNMLRPLTVRLNGAEPDEMYLGNFGVNLGLAGTFDQLTGGIQPALARFSECVSVRLNSEVHGLVVRDGRVQGLEVSENGAAPEELGYDGVVVATPAYATAEIAKSTLPTLSELLIDVRYFPAAVAVVEYDRPVFDDVVRAIAFDSGRCSNAGVYGVDDLNIVRYTFSGRDARPLSSAGELRSWIDDAETMITDLLDVGRVNRVNMQTRIWPAAYCAYLPFYGEFLSKVRAEVTPVPGIELAGDYLRGAPLEACFRSGQEAAQRLLGQMSSHD